MKTYTDSDLSTLRNNLDQEVQRRALLAQAPTIVASLNQQLYAAAGGDGRAWVQPVGGHDAYPLGAIVTRSGKTWKSLVAANVWTPGSNATLWVETTPVTPPEPPVAPAWAAGQSVKVADLRTHNAVVYACLQAHTTQLGWEPPNVPALWKQV